MSTINAAPQQQSREASGFIKLLITLMLFLSYMLFAVAWNWGDLYVRSLGFSASRTALMTNAITLAQVIGSLVAANVLLRLGPRNAFTLASGLIVFGGLVSLTDAFPIIFFIRFVLGLGGALMVVLLSGIVARILTGRALQVANGVNSVAFNTGLAVALTFSVQMSSNPVFAVVLAASLSLVLLVLWLFIARSGLRGAEAQEEQTDSSYTMRDGFREWFNWVFALAYTGLLSYYIVAFTFMDPETIRWVVYAGVIGALAGTIVSARMPDHTKIVVVVVCAAAQIVAAAAVLGLAEHRFAVLVGVILGLVIFFPMPFFVQLAFIRPGVTPRQVAVTFSIFWAVAYAGSVVFIQIFAWITDATGGLENGVPVSTTPLIFIVFVESTFLIGALLLWRWFRTQRALHGPAGADAPTPQPSQTRRLDRTAGDA